MAKPLHSPMANAFAISFLQNGKAAAFAYGKCQLKLPLGKIKLKRCCNIDTRFPFAAPTSRGLPHTASAPHK